MDKEEKDHNPLQDGRVFRRLGWLFEGRADVRRERKMGKEGEEKKTNDAQMLQVQFD